MRNPLNKRFTKELKSDLGKYIVLFAFITVMIGFVSGFFVASESMLVEYEEGFDKYNIEDGNFEMLIEADETLFNQMNDIGVSIYENYYVEKSTVNIDSTLRIFSNRTEINKVCVMKGRLPEGTEEIAIDRLYAVNNNITVGDVLTFEDREYTVTGLVALSDYSALYSSPTDLMFDASMFGVAVVTKDAFENIGKGSYHYSYSWKYNNPPKTEEEEKKLADEVLAVLAKNGMITNFIPQYSNQAIIFAGNDIGSDKNMFRWFLYIVMTIIAFIFAITASNTINKESTVIGTLRASGYSRGEIVRHYMAMPVLVTLVSAVIGNVLGYTVFKKVVDGMYYSNFSLTTYDTLWNINAFVDTTVIPVILMIAINFIVLAGKMKLSPMKFLRRDLSKKKKKKAFKLNSKINIMTRFRLRVIMQNIPNYLTIVVGIFLANIILIFGIALPALIDNHEKEVVNNMICDYQYVLKMPSETKTAGAEKYSASSLAIYNKNNNKESVSVFGVSEDSKYVDLDFTGEKVYISDAFADKYEIKVGQEIALNGEYDESEYKFKVAGIYKYPSGIAVFMEQNYMNKIFGNEAGYFNGYFSNKEIEDIDDKLIGAKITVTDMTKLSRMLEVSMKSLLDLFSVFGILMFMLMIYLLSKIIIEKNAQSISMTKVLGYSNGEISRIYIMSTSIVVIGAILGTIPVVNFIMRYIFRIILIDYSGWLPYNVPFSALAKMGVMGIISYAVIIYVQYRKVRRIPLDMALKNVE